MEGNANKLH